MVYIHFRYHNYCLVIVLSAALNFAFTDMPHNVPPVFICMHVTILSKLEKKIIVLKCFTANYHLLSALLCFLVLKQKKVPVETIIDKRPSVSKIISFSVSTFESITFHIINKVGPIMPKTQKPSPSWNKLCK